MTTIFFDLDDTLYDRSVPFIKSAEYCFSQLTVDFMAAYLACAKRGNEVFHASQRGEITMEEMYVYRYCKGFRDVGAEIQPEEALAFQKIYRQKQKQIRLSEKIERLLLQLREAEIPLGLLTNGPAEKQRSKIQALRLERYIPDNRMIISGEAGVDKPDPAIFAMAEYAGKSDPKDLIFVGDSLSHDILPAAARGWRTVWYTGYHKPDADMPGQCRAETETELQEILRSMLGL